MSLTRICSGVGQMFRSGLFNNAVKCQEFVQKPPYSRCNGYLSTIYDILSPWSVFQRCMATLNQIHRKGIIKPRKKKARASVLDRCPQKRGIILKVMIKKPKKPNSANRRCVRLRLSNGKECIAYVPGEGHNLQEHNIVLVEGGRLQDVPGVKVQCVRGKYDLPFVKKKSK